MTSEDSELRLSATLSLKPGDVVDRAALDAAVAEAMAQGLAVRVFDPAHNIGTMDYLPKRVNIFLDAGNRITAIRRG